MLLEHSSIFPVVVCSGRIAIYPTGRGIYRSRYCWKARIWFPNSSEHSFNYCLLRFGCNANKYNTGIKSTPEFRGRDRARLSFDAFQLLACDFPIAVSSRSLSSTVRQLFKQVYYRGKVDLQNFTEDSARQSTLLESSLTFSNSRYLVVTAQWASCSSCISKQPYDRCYRKSSQTRDCILITYTALIIILHRPYSQSAS
jgi:hypothetical protein